jgi:hypothetical protein
MDTLFPFKWRHFEGDVMPLCVRWYLRYGLSYRDVKELAREREAIGGPHHRVSLGAALCLGVGQVVSALSVRPKKPPYHPRGGRSSTARSRSWSPLIPLW